MPVAEGSSNEQAEEQALKIAERLLAVRRKAEQAGDTETAWAAGYGLKLLRVAVIVDGHLSRLAGKDFAPRAVLEAALRGE